MTQRIVAGTEGKADEGDKIGFNQNLRVDAQASPDLTVRVRPGIAYIDQIQVEKTSDVTSPAMVAPSVDPRIDLVTLDRSGTVAIVTGAEAPSPVAPTYPTEKLVLAEITHTTAETIITNEDDATNGFISKDSRENLSKSESIVGATNTDVDTHSTSGEQTLFSVTIPADALGVGSGYEIIIPIKNADANAAFSRTMTFRLKYGSTTICSAVMNASQGGSNGLQDAAGQIIASIFADGGASVQFGFLSVNLVQDTVDASNASGGAADDGTGAEDSTGALTLSVTVENSVLEAQTGFLALGGYAKRLVG